MDEQRDNRPAPASVSFAKLIGASLLVGLMAAILCAIAWLIARWLKL